MQGGGGGRPPFFDFGDPFAGFGGFGGFGGQRSLLSNFMGGRDPFDDPFFTRPFGGMFGSSIFGPPGNPFPHVRASGFLEHQVPQPTTSRGPIIEELNSDDEREEEGKKEKDNPRKHSRSSSEPYVQHPDDEAEERNSKQLQYTNNFNTMNNMHSQPQNHSFTFQSSTVTYGGVNGKYYTSSKTRRTGSDGLTFEESKEADTGSGKATHKIARGIHDKGHSVTRNLNPNGRVDSMQTLHNLNEDELPVFEETWKGNARKHLPGWSEGSNVHDTIGPGNSVQNRMARSGGWALPSTDRTQHRGKMKPDSEDGVGSSRSQNSGRIKSNIGERAGSSRGRSRTAGNINMDQFGRH